MTEREFILKMPKESKIDCLEEALKQKEFGIFLGLTKILLDTPLNEGGLETEIIMDIYNKNFNDISHEK